MYIQIVVAQFTLLQVLERTGKPMTQGSLGDLLALDSTTLSRTLRPLEHAKWIQRVAGDDARERRIALTPVGRRVLERATPAWERVQRRLKRGLGDRAWAALQDLATRAVAPVRDITSQI